MANPSYEVPSDVIEFCTRDDRVSPAAHAWLTFLITAPWIVLEQLNAPLGKAQFFQSQQDILRYLVEQAYLKGFEAATSDSAPSLIPPELERIITETS